MRQQKLKLCALLLFCLGLTGLYAQEATLTTGGEASGNGGSVSYSVGQLVYITITGTNGSSLTPGVQQPYEITVRTSIEEANGISLKCTAYPNPTTDILFLKVENYNRENLSYQLYDMTGKLLGTKKLTSNETLIRMAGLAPAVYFLKITDNQKEVKIFKIIKNK